MGGGLLIPLGQALTWPLFQPHERAKLSAAVMLVGLLAPACSPAIGGLLVEAFSWRWIFFASLPVALLTFVLAVRWLNDTPVRFALLAFFHCRCWPIPCCASRC